MCTLDVEKARSEYDRLLCMQLLLAVHHGHSRLTWGSRHRQIESAGEHGTVSPALLTELWDALEDVGPRSRAVVVRQRSELVECLGGPIKL